MRLLQPYGRELHECHVGHFIVLQYAVAQVYSAQSALVYTVTKRIYVVFGQRASYLHGVYIQHTGTHHVSEGLSAHEIAACIIQPLLFLYTAEAGIGGKGGVCCTCPHRNFQHGIFRYREEGVGHFAARWHIGGHRHFAEVAAVGECGLAYFIHLGNRDAAEA